MIIIIIIIMIIMIINKFIYRKLHVQTYITMKTYLNMV